MSHLRLKNIGMVNLMMLMNLVIVVVRVLGTRVVEIGIIRVMDG